jgi:hypothetical protein
MKRQAFKRPRQFSPGRLPQFIRQRFAILADASDWLNGSKVRKNCYQIG